MVVGSCCMRLAHALGALVSLPGNASYAASEASYWSLQEAALTPACIVGPKSASDVRTAVSVLVADASCKFAVRGQSHAPAPGFANIDGGATLDMRGLATVSVSHGASGPVAHVGAGASWLDVYAALDPHNLSVAGGRNGAVGVGGLLLGGGISYFAPQQGWACDNVLNYEIVLASGQLADVNATSAPDLFRALKGGANNFGVVTRFDVAAFDQGAISHGVISSPFSELRSVFDAFANLTNASHYDPFASLVTSVTWLPGAGWQAVNTTAIYTKPNAHPAALQGFVNVPGTTGGTLNETRLAPFSNESALPQFEWSFHTVTLAPSADLMVRIVQAWNETVSGTAIPGLVLWSMTFEPLPTAITKWAAKKQGNSLGTTPKDGNSVVVLITALWNNTSSDDLVAKAAGKMIADANRLAKETGNSRSFQYLNYADPSQNPIGSYNKTNVQTLMAASRKYDPNGVFQKNVPGGFKLSKLGPT